MKGPFYVKHLEDFVLAEICRDCGFGDENGCLMNPCIFMPQGEEEEEEEKTTE